MKCTSLFFGEFIELDWFVVDKEYIKYLLQFDSKVGFVEYGEKLKLHIGIVISINSIDYYVPISSAKPKHEKMSNSLDFHKIQDENTNYLYAVINLNNMIPVPSNQIQQLKYNTIQNFRDFSSDLEKTNYIYLLQKEKKIIDKLEDVLKDKARRLYDKVTNFPDSKLACRCCNFAMLEQRSKEYKK